MLHFPQWKLIVVFGVVLAGHFASERFALLSLADYLTDQLADVQVWASRLERDPLHPA